MVKAKREYILGSCFATTIAVIVSVVSLSTQEWVVSDLLVCSSPSDLPSTIKFGLFGGFIQKRVGFETQFEVDMTCLFKHNVCALMCSYNNKFSDYYDGEPVVPSCVGTNKRFQPRADPSCGPKPIKDITFINAGVWLSTLIFMVFSIGFGIFSAGLSVWNTTSSPYQVYFSIFGIYIYNGIACFLNLLAFILWTAEFLQDIKWNIPVEETMAGEYISNGLPTLGYSFWINFVSIFFYTASIGILYTRSVLIAREPEVNVHIEDNHDGTMYLY